MGELLGSLGHYARHANLHREDFRDSLIVLWIDYCLLRNLKPGTQQYNQYAETLFYNVQSNPRNPFKSLEAFRKFISQTPESQKRMDDFFLAAF